MPVAERLAEAEQYVRSADALTRLGDRDNVTGRAYYAVFHCCVALLRRYRGRCRAAVTTARGDGIIVRSWRWRVVSKQQG